MPFENEIEEVFQWKLGGGSHESASVKEASGSASSTSDMPPLDAPESLILAEGYDPEDMFDDSPSRLEWLRQKRDEAEQNEHLDRVMTMIGHEQIKAHFLAVKERMAMVRKWNEDPRGLRLNLVLHKGPDIGECIGSISAL